MPWLLRLRHGQTLFRVLQDSLDLFARHALKPFEKIIHRGTAFKILEEIDLDELTYGRERALKERIAHWREVLGAAAI